MTQTDLQHIDAIIFDLGGVIIDIDYNKTVDAFKGIGIPDFDNIYTQLKQSSLFDDFETGKLEADSFIHALKSKSHLEVSDQQIIDAWNAMLLEIPGYRLESLSKLKNSFRLFVLSNTNSIHILQLNKYLSETYSFESLDPFFEKVYLSHDIGYRKPDADAFQYVVDQNNLNPEKTLFIDDTQGHLQGAKSIGLKTLLNPSNQNVFDFFQDYLK